MKTASRLLRVLPLAFLLTPVASADDWPNWRGPDFAGVSKESGWSSAGAAEPAWVAQVGMGYSSPSVAGGRVFIAGYFPSEENPKTGVDRVRCLRLDDGEELWSHEYPTLAYDNEHAGGALSSPTVVGDTVFVPTRGGEVRAYAVEDGALKWEVDLVERHGVEPGRYGFASSPFPYEDSLVLNAGHTVRLDRATGETVWISEPYEANYSTTVPVVLGERTCFAVFGTKGLVLVDAADGSEVHTYEFRKSPRNVEGATPIVLGQKVFVSTGYDQGGAMVDFSGDAPEELWRTRRMRTKLGGCTLWDGHLYGFDESMLKCIDLEGKDQWRVRGLGQGALSIADGRLLVTTSEGELIVAAATPEEFREISRVKAADRGVFWTSPVLSDGRILVRGSLGDLACMDHRPTAVARADGAAEDTATAELPSPTALAARHLAAAGYDEHPITAVRMTGILDVLALGLDGSAATWEAREGGLWRVTFALPPAYGNALIEKGFDGTAAWERNPLRGNKLIEGDELAELVATRGHQVWLAPLGKDRTARTVGVESFRGSRCNRVDVQVSEDTWRKVYFDVETGLMKGRTCDKESTVVLGDWRRQGEVLLPFERTLFGSDDGQEAKWRFSEAAFEASPVEDFELPDDLR